MLTNLHPELNETSYDEIHKLVLQLAHDARGKGRIRREDMLVAAEMVGESLNPTIDGSVVLQFVMSGLSDRKAVKPKTEIHAHVADLGNRKIAISVQGNTPKSEVVKKPAPVPEPMVPPPSKGQIVTGEEDPFNQVNRSLYKWMVNELTPVKVGQTLALPAADWEEANKIRGLLHGVSKKLNWIPVEDSDKVWRAYLVTIKDGKVFIHRLG